jgi:WhiB family transcriptional regulator, redox-sensing transcriptional regulator
MAKTTEEAGWWELAACQSADPELFFPVSDIGPAIADIARAKAVCKSCRIRLRCLDYAIENRQMHGVWGGTTADERLLASARPTSSTSGVDCRRGI